MTNDILIEEPICYKKQKKKRYHSIKYRNIWAYIFLIPFFAVFLIFQLYPMINSIAIAFTDKSILKSNDTWNLLYNFKFVWNNRDFWQSLFNTLIIFTMNFIPQLIASLLFAIMFTSQRLRMKCTGFFKFIFFLPNILMSSSVAVIFYLMFERETGPLWEILTMLGVISEDYNFYTTENYMQVRAIVAFINFWMWFGNSMIIYMSGIKGISKDIYEAASIDHSSDSNTFFKITLPLLKPLILYSLITSIIGGLQMFDIPQLFLQGGPEGKGYYATQTVTMWIYSMGLDFSKSKRYLGVAGAASIYLFIISLYFSLILFRLMNKPEKDKNVEVLKNQTIGKKRIKVAAAFSILFGYFGIHHFILKNKKKGESYIWITFLTLFIGAIPLWIISIIDCIKLLKGKEIYKYTPKYMTNYYLKKEVIKNILFEVILTILTLGIYQLLKYINKKKENNKIKINTLNIKNEHKKVKIKSINLSIEEKNNVSLLDKVTAIFAFTIGFTGIHKFIKLKWSEGLTYLLVLLSTFGLGLIPLIILSIIDGIELLTGKEKINKNQRSKINTSLIKIPCYMLCIVTALICIIPIYFILINSTRTTQEIISGISLLPGTNLINNLKSVFNLDEINVFRAFLSSCFVSFVGTALCLYFSSLTSFALYAYTFKFKKVAQSIIQAIILIPGQLGMIGFYKLMLNWNLIPSYIPLIIPAIASASTVFYIQQYLKSNFTKDYLEAARIDGTNEFKIFNKICLPMLKPAIATMGLLGIISSWNNYMGPLIYIGTSDKRATFPLIMTILQANVHSVDQGAIYAGILLTLLPLLIIYFILSKWIMAGVASGGVKE